MAKEVFLIEDDGRTALFAPLKGLIMEVDEREREKLSPIINRPQFSFGELREIFPEIEDARLLPEPGEEQGVAENTTDEFQPDSAMLFPTLGCHLRCVYCYSMGGDHALNMNREVVEAAVDFVIRNAESRGLEECSLDFHGGGEPTWDWSVFQSALNYFREKVREYGLKPRVSLATNGTLSSQQVDWITERVQKIQVSLDGMAEIQNSQRPTANNTESFPTVSRTVALLRARGVPVAIHSVITERSMARIPEIIRFFGENFPGATVQIEPAFPCGRGLTSGQHFPAADLFVKGFIGALKLAATFGIEILYSGASHRLTEFRNNFCGATGPNFIVTPTALVTACTEVATMEHPLAGYFIYGRFDRPSGRFQFDREKIKELIDRTAARQPECGGCYARFYCGGECLAKNLDGDGTSKPSSSNPRCIINRELTKHFVLERLRSGKEVSVWADGKQPYRPGRSAA